MQKLQTELKGEEVSLYPARAMMLERHRALLIADLHFGKVAHFRRSGIAVPREVVNSNWEQFIDLLNLTNPERVIFLGDLFHSYHNFEWEEFVRILKHFPQITFELVEGNHDIMSPYQYEKAGIAQFEKMTLEPFLLTHEPTETEPGGLYNLCGHIHPGVKLVGRARQKLMLPCFWFGRDQGILPAFGKFTGLARIKPGYEDAVFAILEDKVLQLK